MTLPDEIRAIADNPANRRLITWTHGGTVVTVFLRNYDSDDEAAQTLHVQKLRQLLGVERVDNKCYQLRTLWGFAQCTGPSWMSFKHVGFEHDTAGEPIGTGKGDLVKAKPDTHVPRSVFADEPGNNKGTKRVHDLVDEPGNMRDPTEDEKSRKSKGIICSAAFLHGTLEGMQLNPHVLLITPDGCELTRIITAENRVADLLGVQSDAELQYEHFSLASTAFCPNTSFVFVWQKNTVNLKANKLGAMWQAQLHSPMGVVAVLRLSDPVRIEMSWESELKECGVLLFDFVRRVDDLFAQRPYLLLNVKMLTLVSSYNEREQALRKLADEQFHLAMRARTQLQEVKVPEQQIHLLLVQPLVPYYVALQKMHKEILAQLDATAPSAQEE